ncbi:myosin-2 heavy chain isoform X1 [Vanessa tameamea]|uniref:Myosin-2 heavy chain isoform X1 n=1 Tax=Vanessa tameamea TaxID=334116 RepID=A0A8B8I4H4_VANTA
MACVDLPSANADSEMEEGEIVDEVDYLSDISSDEEFLLRQRLKVLENYNNALERKEAKRTSIGSGKEHGNKDALYGLSEISGTDVDDGFLKTKFVITKEKKHIKPHHRQKRLKQTDKECGKNKEHRKKIYRNRKKVEVSSDSEASEFSDDDYKNKRRKLADAVALNIVKNDTSTLKDRLSKMLCISKAENLISECKSSPQDQEFDNNHIKATLNSNASDNLANLCTDEVSKSSQIENSPKDIVDASVIDKKEENSVENSDEDLELLRQYALKTKSVKTKNDQKVMNDKLEHKTDALSEDEDSDTAELRMICLKSTLLKKVIELKQKQKLHKRLSTNMNDFDICKPENDLHVDNNTDIESVDMDIGSEGEDKGKELINVCSFNGPRINSSEENNIKNSLRKEDELEEDEDLLRAKLLTSLSKNLPNLVDLNVLNSALGKEAAKVEKKKSSLQPAASVEEKKFIIQLGESDSEGEHEATKNLTKMHIKLSEQAEFQQKLDQFLKTTRLEVEKTTLPDVVQEPVPKPQEKFIAKTMNHLPKSEQIEYKNLVKRMAELEKMKQTRQNLMNVKNNVAKDTLKPRNFTMASKIASAKKVEEKIALSRKRIAEESSKMLKLKEEATKLSQRYKIVATELKNIATAITINKKQQKTVQIGLTKIRHQHQMLLKSSPTKHSNQNLTSGRSIQNALPSVKLQKENDPLNEEHKNCAVLTSVKVTVANDLKKEAAPVSPRSVPVETINNKKNMKLPKSPQKDKVVELKKLSPNKSVNEESINDKMFSYTLDKNTDSHRNSPNSKSFSCILEPELDDYKSPLDSLQCKNWEEDPNAVLCPFEFGGSCRDPDCKYLHPKIPKQE